MTTCAFCMLTGCLDFLCHANVVHEGWYTKCKKSLKFFDLVDTFFQDDGFPSARASRASLHLSLHRLVMQALWSVQGSPNRS
jgi:hypothetical protein